MRPSPRTMPATAATTAVTLLAAFASVAAVSAACALAPIPAVAQAPLGTPATGYEPGPRPEDVASVDAIIAALYDVISGPVGEPRDWDRFRSLFLPGARLIPTAPSPDGGARHQVMSPDDYAASAAESLPAIGFREREIARRTEEFGSIVHAFSTYEGFRGDEAEPFLRGINSIQLFNDGARWWIVTVFWSPEHPGSVLPARYLP